MDVSQECVVKEISSQMKTVAYKKPLHQEHDQDTYN